jgi:glucokinase
MADDSRSLVGDVGGSNARFAVARRVGGAVELTHVRAMRSADYADVVAAVEHYRAAIGGELPRAAAIAIAGPVVGGRAEITNHPQWSFDIAPVRERLGLKHLSVINDFTAVALSLPHLPRHELRQVGPGTAAAGAPMAVIGPGTGLGVSAIVPSDGRWIAVEGEGGHATFAPMSRRESRIGESLRERFGHASWERVLSGPGLVNLYAAIAHLEGARAEELTPEAVAERGLAGSCALCKEAVETFCAALGTAAGNLALTMGARGGVFIGGGIVPQLGPVFDASPFRARFEAKGRLSSYVRPIPTFVITAATPGLVGAAVAV